MNIIKTIWGWTMAVSLLCLTGCSVTPAKQVVGDPDLPVSATKLYGDMLAISRAVDQYRAKHGHMPVGIGMMMVEGFFDEVPALGRDLVGGTYDVSEGFDDMDGQGEMDHAIYTTGMFVPAAVCSEFNRLYASAPLNDGTVFDYQAAGDKYPGEVYGRHMKVFAIKWETARQDCEINWVIEYR